MALKFDLVMTMNWLSINESDKCIFTKSIDQICVILSLFVDDILIFEKSLEVVVKTKEFLIMLFGMKDLWIVDVFLGIILLRDSNDIKLMWFQYIENILRKKFDQFDSSPARMSYGSSILLKKFYGQSV